MCWDLPALSLSCKIMSSDLQDLEDELAYDENSSLTEVRSSYSLSRKIVSSDLQDLEDKLA